MRICGVKRYFTRIEFVLTHYKDGGILAKDSNNIKFGERLITVDLII